MTFGHWRKECYSDVCTYEKHLSKVKSWQGGGSPKTCDQASSRSHIAEHEMVSRFVLRIYGSRPLLRLGVYTLAQSAPRTRSFMIVSRGRTNDGGTPQTLGYPDLRSCVHQAERQTSV